MDSDNDIPPSISTIRAQGLGSHSGRHSLPPPNALGPHHTLPSYPSSTLNSYYPPFHHVTNHTHISAHSQPFSSHLPDVADFRQMPLPSASQSHIPSLRHTPSVPLFENIDNHSVLNPPFFDQRLHNYSRNSERIHSLSPMAFTQRQTVPTAFTQYQSVPTFAAPQPIPLPPHPVSPVQLPLPHTQATPVIPTHLNSPVSYVNSSLPSTKDIPLLSGKHDWGPWHSAVRTLILNSNLLGHIADDPLPGASYDPGLWPTYPPLVHQGCTQAEVQSFTDWWSRDGLALRPGLFTHR
jgi:hypothetical protein